MSLASGGHTPPPDPLLFISMLLCLQLFFALDMPHTYIRSLHSPATIQYSIHMILYSNTILYMQRILYNTDKILYHFFNISYIQCIFINHIVYYVTYSFYQQLFICSR